MEKDVDFAWNHIISRTVLTQKSLMHQYLTRRSVSDSNHVSICHKGGLKWQRKRKVQHLR